MEKNNYNKLKDERIETIKNSEQTREVTEINKYKNLHDTLLFLIKTMRFFNGYKINIMGNIPEIGERPIIIAPNHLRKQDIEIIMEAFPGHTALLSGDYENVHGNINGFMLEKNGIIYFDMEDKEDRNNVKYVINDVLTNGINLLWFYEGSWNLSPNKPYYDGNHYIVQAAIDANALILPVSFEMIDKNMYVNFSDFIDYRAICGNTQLSNEEKIEALDILKGLIGAGLFDIWEKYARVERDSLSEDYWEKYIEEVLSEWKFTEEDIERKHFVDKSYIDPTDVYSHLENLEVNKNNAFLLSKKLHLN